MKLQPSHAMQPVQHGPSAAVHLRRTLTVAGRGMHGRAA